MTFCPHVNPSINVFVVIILVALASFVFVLLINGWIKMRKTVQIRFFIHIFIVLHALVLMVIIVMITQSIYCHVWKLLLIILIRGIILLVTLVSNIGRAYFTFRDTQYKMSKTELYISIILALIVCTLITIAILSEWVNIYKTWYTHNGNYQIGSGTITHIIAILATFASFYLILFAYTTSQFIFRLRKVSVAAKNSVRNLQKLSELNKRQIKMLNQLSKYLFLQTLSLVSSFISFVFVGLWFTTFFGNIPFFISMQAIFATDIIITNMCLYLQYAFASKWYNKCCICDIICKRIMKIDLMTQMKQMHTQNIEAVQSKSDV